MKLYEVNSRLWSTDKSVRVSVLILDQSCETARETIVFKQKLMQM